MRSNELKELLDHRPFRPIRIHITSGEYVDVIHPEMALVGRSAFVVALRPVRGVADAFAWYSLIHIVKVVSLRRAKRRKRRA